MESRRPPLFRKRQFEPVTIVTCVRWYLRFPLSARDVEELIAERRPVCGSYDHLAVGTEVRPGAEPAAARSREAEIPDLAHGRDFRCVGGRQTYLLRAVDSYGQTVDFYLSETRDREAAKIFLRKALANPDNRPPHVFTRDGLRS